MNGILTGPASTVAGASSVAFDAGKALSILHLMEREGVCYGLGSKPFPLTASPPTFAVAPGRPDPSVDCSGFHRYVLFHAAGVLLPDGSIAQNDFYAAQGFRRHRTAGPGDPAYLTGLDPAYVYACFCRTGTRGETIGHVWLVAFLNGRWWTIESHGGKGPDSRPHDTPILAHIVTDFYPISKVG